VHGLTDFNVHAAEGMAPTLSASLQAPGTHVVVVRTDRDANVGVHEEVHAAVAEALG